MEVSVICITILIGVITICAWSIKIIEIRAELSKKDEALSLLLEELEDTYYFIDNVTVWQMEYLRSWMVQEERYEDLKKIDQFLNDYKTEQ